MKLKGFGNLWLIAVLLLPAACSSLPGKTPTTTHMEKTAVMGPYSEFSGRLLVMQPRRRWQVSLQWAASSPGQGWLRLSHAASNSVIELRWQNQDMQLRSNTHTAWQAISERQLAEQGIVLPPQQLAALLLGHVPDHFVQKPGNGRDDIIWESQGLKSFMRLQWRASSQRLSMTDMTHGRRAILIIQHVTRPLPENRQP
ncbi:MAG: lipoprotein insertase outer membrane protein LolB [Mariprofundaceae bacterium]